MAHEIESMFSVKKIPWHKLGTVLENAPTSAEAMRLAGLDWDVNCEAMLTTDGQIVPGHRAVRRSTDGSVLGVVGNDWTPLQNSKVFEWFDPFVQAGEASYETAGSLHKGARVWVLAKLNREPCVIVQKAGDIVDKYVLLSNGHDGIISARVGFTPVRVVCANTLRLAHDHVSSKLMRVTHTSKIVENMKAVRQIMDMADAEFEATAEQYRALAGRSINASDLNRYVTKVFYPNRPEPTPTENCESESRSRIVDNVTKLFESGMGNDLDGVKGTMWGAYNAVTEYLSHERGSDDAIRLNNLWYGSAAKTNQRALDVAYQYVYNV